MPDTHRVMSDAPKDGSEILVAYPRFKDDTVELSGYQIMLVKWNGRGWNANFGWLLHEEPLCWWPLPAIDIAQFRTPTSPP